MHLSNRDLKNLNELDSRLLNTLRHVRKVIQVGEAEFSEMLNMDVDSYRRMNSGLLPVSLVHLLSLEKAIDLNIDVLMSGQIDYKSLQLRYCKNEVVIPERYADKTHQLAKVRAVKSMIQSVTQLRGEEYASRILGRLQLNGVQLNDPDQGVSPQIGIDLLRELERSGFRKEEISYLGAYTMEIARDTPAGRVLGCSKNASELYRMMFEEFAHTFDQVWSYQLMSLTSNECRIKISQNPRTLDVFRSTQLGNRNTCLYLQGVFSSLATHVEKFPAKLTETSCMYHGDLACVYDITWSGYSRLAEAVG